MPSSDASTPSSTAAGQAVPAQRKARVGLDEVLALLDTTSAVVYMRDRDGRYLLINREYERLFGIHRDEILGFTDHDLFPPQIADAFRANDREALERADPIRVEESAPGPDGEVHTYITVKFRLVDQAGEPFAVCGISTDISAQKRMQTDLEDRVRSLEEQVRARTGEARGAEAELDAFAYSVSNDLRTPLRALHGFSEALIDDHADRLDDTGRQYLGRIQASAARMDRIIDDLLRLALTDRADLHREEVDLGALGRAVVRDLQSQEPNRQVQLSCRASLLAQADPHLTTLAVRHLVANAWKFTANRRPGQITMGALAREGETVFFVRDNGEGFGADLAEKIFQPFQHHHDLPDVAGNGIGLAIAQRAVRRHGGRIWAESRPGEGATFYFTLTD